jgi:hypothetical protein
MSPILGIWASSKVSATPDTGAMFPLQVITVGAAGASSVTFTNIPSTYSHLQIRVLGRSDRANVGDDLYVQFNSDTTSANYNYTHRLYGTGSSATSEAFNSSPQSRGAGWLSCANSGANNFAANIIDILDYANTNKYKTIRTFWGSDMNGSGYVGISSGMWANTNAISSMTFKPTDGTKFVQYSQFALYAVKGA